MSPGASGGRWDWKKANLLRIPDEFEQIPVRIADIDALTYRVSTVTSTGPLPLRNDLSLSTRQHLGKRGL